MPRLFFIHAGETPNAAYLLPWERRRLGGTEVVKAVSDANRAHFVQNLQNSHREPARTPALPGRPGSNKYAALGETPALPGRQPLDSL